MVAVTIDRIDFAQVLDFFRTDGYATSLKMSNEIYDKCFSDENNITEKEIREAGNIIKQSLRSRAHASTIVDRLMKFRQISMYE